MSFEELKDLNGKVAVVTGGGQVANATVKRLANKGARIYQLVRRDLDSIQQALNNLPNGPHRAILFDITKTETIKKAVNEIDRCDILVNTVGRNNNIKAPMVELLNDTIFDEIIITNIRGTFAVIREFLKLLKESKDGLIINISSQAGQRGGNSNIAYSASKAGIDIMTKSLGQALAPRIRVISIAPGFLEEPTSGTVRVPGALERIAESSPLKRIGSAEDIACAVEAYCTTIRFANATTVLIDGGRMG